MTRKLTTPLALAGLLSLLALVSLPACTAREALIGTGAAAAGATAGAVLSEEYDIEKDRD